MSDTTAAGPAPDAASLGAARQEREFAGAVDGFRRRRDTELARMAMLSAGDVTKAEGYGNLAACIAQLRALEQGGGGNSMGGGLQAAADAQAALLRHRAAFKAAFSQGGSEGARYIYAGAVMALYATVTLLCAQAVAYRPDGGSGSLMPHVDTEGAARVAQSMPAVRLARFAQAARTANFEAALARMAPAEKEALSEGFWTEDLARAAKRAGASTAAGALLGAAFGPQGALIGAGVSLVLSCLFGARDIAAYVYETRAGLAGWLDTQAAFLQMNASALDPSKREARAKQEQYAARLRSLADRVKVVSADAERGAAEVVRGDERALSAAGAQGGLV